jgi:hypothetical protein
MRPPEELVHGYHCRTCGKFHGDLPLSFGPDAPVYWYGLSETEREQRSELSTDQCIIDHEHFFIRGRLEIPIIGSGQCFTWLVWTTLSEENFVRASELWDTKGRESEPPYFGWLSVELASIYNGVSTVNLETLVHTRPVGSRPYVELEATDHPLAIEQRKGMTWDRVHEIAERLLHP